MHPAVAACVKLCCHDDTPARLAQGRSGGDDELDVPCDGVCTICIRIRGRKLSAVLWVSESETWKYMQTLSVHEDFHLRL